MNAFPETRTEWNPDSEAREVTSAPGMTLRDYFAAKAMQAYTGDESWRIDMDMRQTATAAYAMADAMLKARKQ